MYVKDYIIFTNFAMERGNNLHCLFINIYHALCNDYFPLKHTVCVHMYVNTNNLIIINICSSCRTVMSPCCDLYATRSPGRHIQGHLVVIFDLMITLVDSLLKNNILHKNCTKRLCYIQ